MNEPIPPLVLGQRLVELCEGGRRVSTYKLACLMSIIDVALEHEPAPDGSLAVPVQELAHRVIAYYWRQSRPYLAGGLLRQNEQVGKTIPDLVAALRHALAARQLPTAEAARESQDSAYLRTVRQVELTLAQQPLTHLQTRPGRSGSDSGDFLFDASGLHKKMSHRALSAHGPIVLRPGVPHGLRQLASLLRPMIEMMWTADVTRMNRDHLEHEDLAGFLFGTDRTALSRLTPHLLALQDNRCFYCDSGIREVAHVDHVLPWSRIPIDGVANLVVTDARCNLDKRATLPVPRHFQRAISRPRAALTEVAIRAGFPVLETRTRTAGTGLYSSIPPGTSLWSTTGTYEISE